MAAIPVNINPPKKVAIVHYWFENYRGGEKVVDAILKLFPEADIFTHSFCSKSMPESIRNRKIQTTFIQNLPAGNKHFRYYLPLMPLALEQLDLNEYDLVISSESGPAKGVITSPNSLHLCYCHSPMRYLWDQYHSYRNSSNMITRFLMAPLFHYLRQWDLASSSRVDSFIANSRFVAARIRKSYRREATVIYPPVEIDHFRADSPRQDFYLTVSALVHYKRVDIIVKAFTQLGLRLVVIGDGPKMKELRKIAGPNIKFLGRAPDKVVVEHLEQCKAFVYAGEEDFGISPVEAQAAGAPVIGFGRGGLRETVIDGKTGIFFPDQTPESLQQAVLKYENGECALLPPQEIHNHSEKFKPEIFQQQLSSYIAQQWSDHIGRL